MGDHGFGCVLALEATAMGTLLSECLATTPKVSQALGKRYKPTVRVAKPLVLVVSRWLPEVPDQGDWRWSLQCD